MSNIWTYHDEVSGLLDEVVGYEVEATDGHIGKVDEASVVTDDAHLVVDTGFWIFGKKRVIPAGVVARVDKQEERLYLTLTKDQVKDAPDWKDSWGSDTTSRNEYTEYYRSYGMR